MLRQDISRRLEDQHSIREAYRHSSVIAVWSVRSALHGRRRGSGRRPPRRRREPRPRLRVSSAEDGKPLFAVTTTHEGVAKTIVSGQVLEAVVRDGGLDHILQTAEELLQDSHWGLPHAPVPLLHVQLPEPMVALSPTSGVTLLSSRLRSSDPVPTRRTVSASGAATLPTPSAPDPGISTPARHNHRFAHPARHRIDIAGVDAAPPHTDIMSASLSGDAAAPYRPSTSSTVPPNAPSAPSSGPIRDRHYPLLPRLPAGLASVVGGLLNARSSTSSRRESALHLPVTTFALELSKVGMPVAASELAQAAGDNLAGARRRLLAGG